MVWPTMEMAQTHYKDLSKKPFFPSLCQFFSSGPIICMCWEGKDIIKQGRQMLGETQPLASKPGSIRGDYSIDLGRLVCKCCIIWHCYYMCVSLSSTVYSDLCISSNATLYIETFATEVIHQRQPLMNWKCGFRRV